MKKADRNLLGATSGNSTASAYAASGRYGETGGGEIVVVGDVLHRRKLNPR